ncbi:hypothetical protein HYT55_05935 [Candidatus Woesearchaeota archaeon]|nr:hypothetical protein [Candidatus Woesearchaeota archaeon]
MNAFMREYVVPGTPQSRYVTSVGYARIPGEPNGWKVVVGLEREPDRNLYLPSGIEYKINQGKTLVE